MAWRLAYLGSMTLRGIFFGWSVAAAVGTAVTFFIYRDSNNKWLNVVTAMGISVIALAVLLFITLMFYRYFRFAAMRFLRSIFNPAHENQRESRG